MIDADLAAQPLWDRWLPLHDDVDARNELVMLYMDIVETSAARTARVVPTLRDRGVLVEDLVNEGALALMSAVERYSPERGPFENYARLKVSRALMDFLRTEAPQSRPELGRQKRVRAHIEKVIQSTGVVPSARDVVVDLTGEGVTVDLSVVQTVLSRYSVHAGLEHDSDGTETLAAFQDGDGGWAHSGQDADPAMLHAASDYADIVARALRNLDPDHVAVIGLVYRTQGPGRTHDPATGKPINDKKRPDRGRGALSLRRIAGLFGCSPAHVSKMRDQAIAALVAEVTRQAQHGPNGPAPVSIDIARVRRDAKVRAGLVAAV